MLNRPNSYNALHSAAHFELDEIFNTFEADQNLWVGLSMGLKIVDHIWPYIASLGKADLRV